MTRCATVVSFASLFVACAPARAEESGCSVSVIGTTNTTQVADANVAKIGNCILELQKRVATAESAARDLRAELDRTNPIQNAVIAFDSEKCPDKWTPYQYAIGRFILGAIPQVDGHLVAIGGGIPPISAPRGDRGGMRVGAAMMRFQSGEITTEQGSLFLNFSPPLQTSSPPFRGANYGQAITYNLAPPYVALLYCKKD